MEKAHTDFLSDTLGTAGDIVAGGGEFAKYAPTVEVLPTVDQGLITFQGEEYVWHEGQYQRLIDVGAEEAGLGSGMSLSELLGTGAITSDMYLKENIDLVSKSHNGINIYTFEYKDKKHGEGVYRGVMAQEVPWASVKTDDGYLAVDYSKVDVDFERIA